MSKRNDLTMQSANISNPCIHIVEMGLVNFLGKLQVKVQVTVVVMDKQD